MAFTLVELGQKEEAFTKHKQAFTDISEFLDKPDLAACYDLASICNGYGVSLRKQRISADDIEEASKSHTLAMSEFAIHDETLPNILINNAAITLSQSANEDNLIKACQLLTPQVKSNIDNDQYLFVSPYYLADAYLKLANLYLESGELEAAMTTHYQAESALFRAKQCAEHGKYDSQKYRRKALARVERLQAFLHQLKSRLIPEFSAYHAESSIFHASQAINLYRGLPDSYESAEKKQRFIDKVNALAERKPRLYYHGPFSNVPLQTDSQSASAQPT